ncbi:MAG: 2,3-bisphosphoglycerate-independent phosphoglycerate mutase [Actinomycetota bacterium]
MDNLVASLATDGPGKIVLVVMDGLGGIRTAASGSELAEARTPDLDRLAGEGSSGLHTVVAPGITPGSGAGHLALFGYDPLVYQLGRGVLSAAGVGFDLTPGDVAARVNFCTLDGSGAVVDRRAGRISDEVNRRLCRAIREHLDLGGKAEVFLETERDHRALLVLRGEGLSPKVADTDPQITGALPKDPEALVPEAGPTAALLSEALTQIRSILAGERANFILLRGFDSLRELPSFGDRYRLRAVGVAAYPMYLGIARLLGMASVASPPVFAGTVDAVEQAWEAHSFFYVHYKKTDSSGEDGNFEAKVSAIEEVDAEMPRIEALGPEVICVTGDHATPSQLRAHSWHPVPFLMWGPRVGVDSVSRFDEEAARVGAFGLQSAKDLMALMLAAAGRLAKFGA